MKFCFVVGVDTDTEEHAQEVMTERIGYEEEIGDGFDYTIDRAPNPLPLRNEIEERIMRAWKGKDAFNDILSVIDDLLVSK